MVAIRTRPARRKHGGHDLLFGYCGGAGVAGCDAAAVLGFLDSFQDRRRFLSLVSVTAFGGFAEVEERLSAPCGVGTSG